MPRSSPGSPRAAPTAVVESPDRVDRHLSLASAAEQLGVHYMTAYRYLRTGRLPAIKRAGKWCIDPEDLRVLHRAATSDAEKPAADRTTTGAQRRTARVSDFSDRLIASDEAGAFAIVTSMLTAGASPTEVYQTLFVPVLRDVGEQWADGRLSIADEHRATATVNRLLGRMAPLFRPPGRRRGTIVVGAIEQDRHAIPTAMLSDMLRANSFDVIDLGAYAPAECFIDVARSVDDLVGIGVCFMYDELAQVALEQVRTIRTALPTEFIVLGGAGMATVEPAHYLAHVDAITTSGVDACAAFERALTERAKRTA